MQFKIKIKNQFHVTKNKNKKYVTKKNQNIKPI